MMLLAALLVILAIVWVAAWAIAERVESDLLSLLVVIGATLLTFVLVGVAIKLEGGL